MTLTEQLLEFFTRTPVVFAAGMTIAWYAMSKWVDHRIARRDKKAVEGVSYVELLQQNERDFRMSIITQLGKCNEQSKALQDENQKLVRDNLSLERQLLDLEVELNWVTSQLNRAGIDIQPYQRLEKKGKS